MAPSSPSALLLLVALTSAAGRVFSLGTLLVLFPEVDLKGSPPAWVVPDPTKRCADLPPGLAPKSAKVWWDSPQSPVACSSLRFYPLPSCRGPPTPLTPPLPSAHRRPRTSHLRDLSADAFTSLSSTKSVECFTEPADSLRLPLAAGPGGGSTAWMSTLNAVRSEASPSARPLNWDNQLAALAQNWTSQLSAAQCGASRVVLSKIPDTGAGESDVYVSFSADEGDAVSAWAPNPHDFSNPRTARIVERGVERVGCGKTACGNGAFFTCLFQPVLS